jgi:hypothetical protein
MVLRRTVPTIDLTGSDPVALMLEIPWNSRFGRPERFSGPTNFFLDFPVPY